MAKIPGGRVKVVGIPGVHQKLRKNHFQGGSMQKNEKLQGVTVNLTENPGGQLQKKIEILNRGRGYKFFLKKPILPYFYIHIRTDNLSIPI